MVFNPAEPDIVEKIDPQDKPGTKQSDHQPHGAMGKTAKGEISKQVVENDQKGSITSPNGCSQVSASLKALGYDHANGNTDHKNHPADDID